MTSTLVAMPAEQLTDDQFFAERTSLVSLASLGADELTARLHRALPGAEAGRVAVAAFQSSI
ncbi:FxSxx-COOH cyclophane-containing RiPP peptide [Kitasatospora sp. NPDC002040]|uniref:FxSxx-COOH cyclophane-containing RiPP peptide n=1 Tax=Kitasatospora sp. NPDC002040 TaxID=3154661 RepID=UPI003317B650